MKVRALAIAVALLFVACGPRSEGLDASKLPVEVRGDYEVFARRCSKCHGLARPLQSGITDDQQWIDYVRRMRRQPASGITADDELVILRFLRYYAADLRKQKAETNGAAPTTSSPSPPPPAVAEGGAP